jgi:hypothetical protein
MVRNPKDAEARRAEAQLTPEQARQRYMAETELVLAEAKQPARAIANLKNRLASARQLLSKLKTQ